MYKDIKKELELLAIFADILGYRITKSKGIWHIWKNSYGNLGDKPCREYVSFDKMVSLYNKGFESPYRGKRWFGINKDSFNAKLLMLPRKPLTIQRKDIR